MDDHGIEEMIPPNLWLTNRKTKALLLAMMAHRLNKEIASQPGTLPPCRPRDSQRDKSSKRLSSARVTEMTTANQADPDFLEERKIRMMAYARTNITRAQHSAVNTQLMLYTTHKDSYVAKLGQEAYGTKVIELLGKLPDPGNEPTPVTLTLVDKDLSPAPTYPAEDF